jgi:hypothetical protein
VQIIDFLAAPKRPRATAGLGLEGTFWFLARRPCRRASCFPKKLEAQFFWTPSKCPEISGLRNTLKNHDLAHQQTERVPRPEKSDALSFFFTFVKPFEAFQTTSNVLKNHDLKKIPVDIQKNTRVYAMSMTLEALVENTSRK